MKRREGNIRLEKRGYGARPADPPPVKDRALKGSLEYDPMAMLGADYFAYLDRKDRGETDPEPLTPYEKKALFHSLKEINSD